VTNASPSIESGRNFSARTAANRREPVIPNREDGEGSPATVVRAVVQRGSLPRDALPKLAPPVRNDSLVQKPYRE